MEFQQFFDPFGSALQAQGAQLANDGKSLSNQIQLYKLGQAKMDFDTEKEYMERAKVAAAGQPTPTSLQDLGAGATEAGAGPNSALLFKQANSFMDESKRFAPNNPMRERYEAKAESTLKNAVDQRDKEFNQQQTFIKNLGEAAAAGAASPEAWGREWKLLESAMPPGMNKDNLLKTLGLPMGDGGVPRYNKDTLESIGANSSYMKEMNKLAHEKQMEDARKASERLADERERRLERESQRREASARDAAFAGKLKPGYKWTDDSHTQQELIPTKGDPKPVNEEQKRLDKDPLYRNDDRYQQAAATVSDLENKIKTGAPIEASDIQRLRAHYANIIQDFRSRAGGVKDMQQFDKLNGAIQSLDKWVESIGKGTPAASMSVARQAMATVSDEITARNKATVIEGLRSAALVEKRGGDPNQLRLKGNVGWLISHGQATEPKPDDEGNMWIGIKVDGQIKAYRYPQGAF